jgi:hypothetical protein
VGGDSAVKLLASQRVLYYTELFRYASYVDDFGNLNMLAGGGGGFTSVAGHIICIPANRWRYNDHPANVLSCSRAVQALRH